MSKAMNKFAPEVRGRAVLDHEADCPTCWTAIGSISEKLGCVPQTPFEWVKKAEIDTGKRAGLPIGMADRFKVLERENRELCQANEIHREAAVYFDQAAPSTYHASCAFDGL
jgi:transposase-like protein